MRLWESTVARLHRRGQRLCVATEIDAPYGKVCSSILVDLHRHLVAVRAEIGEVDGTHLPNDLEKESRTSGGEGRAENVSSVLTRLAFCQLEHLVLGLQFRKTVYRRQDYPPDNVGLPIGLAWGWIAACKLPEWVNKQSGAKRNTELTKMALQISYDVLFDWWQRKSYLRYCLPFNLFFAFARAGCVSSTTPLLDDTHHDLCSSSAPPSTTPYLMRLMNWAGLPVQKAHQHGADEQLHEEQTNRDNTRSLPMTAVIQGVDQAAVDMLDRKHTLLRSWRFYVFILGMGQNCLLHLLRWSTLVPSLPTLLMFQALGACLGNVLTALLVSSDMQLIESEHRYRPLHPPVRTEGYILQFEADVTILSLIILVILLHMVSPLIICTLRSSAREHFHCM